MRDYAITYPQLVRQAMAVGLDDRGLSELRGAFEVGQRYFDGLYRADGQPFICYMTRTASIVLAEEQPLSLVKAALVHGAYDAHRYEHSTRPWPGSRLRRRLRGDVGSGVEEIVWAFHETEWARIGSPEIQLRRLPSAGAVERLALILHVANELESHMDLALTYRSGHSVKQRIEADASAIVQVATELGLATVADELTTAFRDSLEASLPAVVRGDHSRGYELPVGRTSRTSKAVRFAGRARQSLRLRVARVRRTRSASARRSEAARRNSGEAVTSAPRRSRILVTGAAGTVGREIVPFLREHFSLRLLDRQRIRRESDDEVIRADVLDTDALRRACRDVSAIVHLAAVADPQAEFVRRLLPANVHGTYEVFEAARRTGVGRVILASTGQVVGEYPPSQWVDTDAPVRPSTVYACTKVFGEAIARHYSDCHGVDAVCLRIGSFQGYDTELSHSQLQRIFCSSRDLARLIVKSIQSDVPFAVLFAVSDNPSRNWDLDNARTTVGYVPRDRVPDNLVGDTT